jgi:hypothetical protein
MQKNITIHFDEEQQTVGGWGLAASAASAADAAGAAEA